jgi:hypothetical protein
MIARSLVAISAKPKATQVAFPHVPMELNATSRTAIVALQNAILPSIPDHGEIVDHSDGLLFLYVVTSMLALKSIGCIT